MAMSGVARSQPWRSQWSCGDVRGRPQPTLEEPMVVWRCQGSPAANPGGANGRVAMSGVARSQPWRSQWSCGDVRGRPQPTLEEPMVVWRCQGSAAANPGGANGRVAMSGVGRSQTEAFETLTSRRQFILQGFQMTGISASFFVSDQVVQCLKVHHIFPKAASSGSYNRP